MRLDAVKPRDPARNLGASWISPRHGNETRGNPKRVQIPHNVASAAQRALFPLDVNNRTSASGEIRSTRP